MFKDRKERIVATIEARMTSSRLPGKVMLPLMGRPALQLMIDRLKRSRYVDGMCIATTTNSADDVLEALAREAGVLCFRGSETDVLGRVLGAARSARADIIVELTGDCPFVDPRLVDRGIEEFFSRDYDYVANTITSTFPNGFDVQVFPTHILAEVDSLTNDPIDRAHVSYYIYTHPERYRCYNWEARPDEHGPELRVTLDEKSDYDALTMIAQALESNSEFDARDVVAYLRSHPDVAALNANVRQKEAYEL
jgi:spore coat polysaccharide biosynthesis protein SpsF